MLQKAKWELGKEGNGNAEKSQSGTEEGSENDSESGLMRTRFRLAAAHYSRFMLQKHNHSKIQICLGTLGQNLLRNGLPYW